MLKQFLAICVCSTLVACGGGSDSDGAIKPPVVAKSKEQAMAELLTSQADNYILPANQAFAEQALAFQQASLNFCSLSSPSLDDLNTLKQAWFSLSQDWQFTKAVKMGPVSEEFRNTRIQFWPDESRAVSRGVASLLASAEIDYHAVTILQDGAQGIPALEVLIYNDQDSLLSANDKADRCLAVMAIAENVAVIANEVSQLWSHNGAGFVNDFKQGSGKYDTQQAVLEDFITNWFELIEVISDNKINNVLSFAAPGNPAQAEQYLSQTSIDNIKQNFAAINKAYYGGEGYGFDDYLDDIHSGHQVGAQIDDGFSEISQLLGNLEVPLEEMVANPEEREQLVVLINKIRDFRSLLATDFIQLTELNPNFNSNDGD